MINWPIEIKENKYKRWYEELMHKAQLREPLVGYKERHHIIPNCFIKNKNRVELTAREHYIAHLLLWKMNMSPKNHNQMTMALNVMVNGSGHKKQDRSYLVNSRIYEAHRKEYSKYLSEYMSGPNNPFRGKKHSPEAIEKIKEANRRTKHIRSAKASGANNPMYGKKHSQEMKEKIRASTSAAWTTDLRNSRSKEMKEKWKNPQYKKQMVEIRLTSPGWLNREWSVINKKAAETRRKNGTDKRTPAQRKQLSETRKAKIASGDIVPWNRGVKLRPDQINYTTYSVISPDGVTYTFKGRDKLKEFCCENQLGYWSMLDLINGKEGKNRLYLAGWKRILPNSST